MALTEAIIVMAHKLWLKVIAEGAEPEGQSKLPLAAQEFERLLVSMGGRSLHLSAVVIRLQGTGKAAFMIFRIAVWRISC